MVVIRSVNELKYNRNTVLTVGTFDGLHLGHQKIINYLVENARSLDCRSLVITFEPHPKKILNDPETLNILSTTDEKKEYCEKYGIDYFLVLEFNKEFSLINFRDFYVNYIIKPIGLKLVIEGYNHHWGKNREGNPKTLEDLGKEFDFKVICIPPVTYEGEIVSSSLIRKELIDGNVEKVEKLLNRPYSLAGKVVKGDTRGKVLGYPTANIEPDSDEKLIPKNGSYFVKVLIHGQVLFGMANVGIRPTFDKNGKRSIEVNILDFSKDIYGSHIRIEFLKRLRDELKFESAQKLVEQIERDKQLSEKLKFEYLKKSEYIHK